MALNYKIEWFRDGDVPSQQGMFVHTTEDMPCYQEFITKEDYVELSDSEKCDFVTALFAIEGIVEVSVKAYRVYVIKAELFQWESLAVSVVQLIGTTLGESVYNEQPGSRMNVESVLQRRQL